MTQQTKTNNFNPFAGFIHSIKSVWSTRDLCINFAHGKSPNEKEFERQGRMEGEIIEIQ